MKRIIYSITLLLVMAFQSCESVVDNLNNDPNNFTDSPLNLIMNHTRLNVAAIAEAHPNRIATIFTDQFGGNDRQYGTLNIYSTLQADYNEIWEDVYQRGVTQAQIASAKAREANDLSLEAGAVALESYFFGEAALLFGDIPFSQVNDSEFSDPKYEGQASVLASVIDNLKQSIADGGTGMKGGSMASKSSSDVQIMQALLARYYLALGDYTSALAAAQSANFISKDNDWEIVHTTTNFSENFFYQFQVEQRQDYLKVEGSLDFSYLSKLLNSTEAVYKGNSKTNESARFNYYVDGSDINTSLGGFAAIDQNYAVISFEEIQLIIAEASVELNDNTRALNALNAVRASHASRFTGGQYDAYVATDFQDGGELYDGNSEDSSLMMEILLEKYCSVIGLPTYSDVRRTHNLIGVPIKGPGTNVIPQRFLYPQTETASNANFPGVVDQYEPTPINK